MVTYLNKYIVISVIIVIMSIILYYYFLSSSEGEKYVLIALEVQDNIGGRMKPEPGIYLYNYSSVNITFKAFPEKDYIFLYWLVNGSNKVDENPLRLVLNGNTTIKPFFKRIYFYVQLDSNGTLFLNGSRIDTPYTLRYKEKITLNISGIRWLENNTIYYPKTILLNNISVENPVKLEYRNASIKLLYGVEKYGENKILITSNTAGHCYINGSRIDLPAYVGVGRLPFTNLSADFSLPLNNTYSYYIGWYKIVYQNNESETISYYKQNTIKLNRFMRKIYIHYVRGLKNLPYILKIHYFPPFRWNYTRKYWLCHTKIENKSIIFYNFTNKFYTSKIENSAGIYIIFEFDDDVTGIWLEYFPKNARLAYSLRSNIVTLSIKFMKFSSKDKWIPDIPGFHQLPNRKHIIFIGRDKWIGENFLDNNWSGSFFDPDTDIDLYLPDTDGRYGLFFKYDLPLKPDNGSEYILIFKVLGVVGND